MIRKSLKDTGERMVPEYHKAHLLYGEHIVRYQAAQRFAANKVVLDIACGSGYGTKMLAKDAKKVYGLDINAEAIGYANNNYSAANIEFLESSATTIRLEDNSIDLAVSFETLEHIKDYKKFIAEVKRVLKPDGTFIVSTPNDKEFPEDNQFHEHEFTYAELNKLLADHFGHRQFYFQGTWLYNGLFREDDIENEWQKPVTTIQTAPVRAGDSIYFVAVCSDSPITQKLEPLAAMSEAWSERRRRGYEQTTTKHIEEQATIIKHLGNEIKHEQELTHVLEEQLKMAQAQLNRFNKSLAGKAYHAARKVKRSVDTEKNT